MEDNAGSVQQIRPERGKRLKNSLLGIGAIAVICVVWFIAAHLINSSTVLPYFEDTMKAFFTSWTNQRVMTNMAITMGRVLTGTLLAILIGSVLGLLMGYYPKINKMLSPLVNSIRQVPIMAWVPLAIVWFGLGEGPTVFLIFMSALFPMIIYTIAGVISIDENYFNAARSMGASTAAIFKDIIIPGTLPTFLMGCRLAVGAGWMSVICAEFIATSSGFGYLMIEAQQRIQTPELYALMIMSAIIGFAMDRLIFGLEIKITGWRFKNGQAQG